MIRCRVHKLCIALIGLSVSVHAQHPAKLAGTWEGVFNGQPQHLQPDGSYPETRTRFRLTLRFSQPSKLTGTLTVIGSQVRSSKITDSLCDVDGCIFQVVDYGDETTPQAWRVWIENGELHGTRNRGPLRPYGIGPGARLFKIEARRASTK
jgi:hypothetical protein